MSHYIPDNAEVTMFYQQFTEVLTMAAIDEQARIIKLLEDEKFNVPEGINQGITYVPIEQAIALIKGEQK